MFGNLWFLIYGYFSQKCKLEPLILYFTFYFCTSTLLIKLVLELNLLLHIIFLHFGLFITFCSLIFCLQKFWHPFDVFLYLFRLIIVFSTSLFFGTVSFFSHEICICFLWIISQNYWRMISAYSISFNRKDELIFVVNIFLLVFL